MNQTGRINFIVFAVLFLSPSIAYAHSPGGYIVATFSIVIISAILTAFVKKLLLKNVFPTKEQLKFESYFFLAVSEIVIMVLSLAVAIKIDNSGNSLEILGMACVLYFVVALFPHFIVLKNAESPYLKVIQATALFPVFIWICALTIFVPLYILFGG